MAYFDKAGYYLANTVGTQTDLNVDGTKTTPASKRTSEKTKPNTYFKIWPVKLQDAIKIWRNFDSNRRNYIFANRGDVRGPIRNGNV